MEYFSQLLIVIGILLIIAELTIFGLATFVLLFLGVSLIVNGSLMYFNVLESTWLVALWSNALLTFVLALLFWKPLKRFQNQTEKVEGQSDFSDKEFTLEADVDKRGLTEYQYSGVMWMLKSHEPIEAGTLVKVSKIDVGVIWVEKK
jgi:inner membrane protein